MSILSSLLLLILVARIFGEIFKRFQQPALLGEILAGILLGPSVLNLIGASAPLSGISELAMFLIILSAGLEMDFKQVIGSFKGKGLVVAFLGFAIPFAGGILVGHIFELDRMRTIFLGLCISITALPVAIRILKSFNLLNHPISQYSVVTAVVNDVLALFALGIILKLPEGGDYSQLTLSIGWGVIKLIVLVLFILAMNYALEKIETRGIKISWVPEKLVELFGKEALLGILIIFVLAVGSVSEILGSHFVIGAFFGALLIDRKLFLSSRFDEIEQSLSSINSGFLAPIFFVYLGLECNIRALPSISLLITIIFISIATKVFAGWLAGKLIGLHDPMPLGIGVILNGRGVMELIVAKIAYNYGFIGEGLYSALVLMGIVTTFITPIMFKHLVVSKLQSEATA